MGYSRPGNTGVTGIESSINSSIDEASPKMSRCGGKARAQAETLKEAVALNGP